MADGLTIEMDTTALVAALTKLGAAAQPFINAACQETANALVREMKARLQRQLGPNATGQTVAGIETRPAYDGNGFVVIADNARMPNLPLWLEKGTKKGRKRSHASSPLNFFYVSCQLEEGPHLRRITAAVTEAIAASGLGD